jgi:uncharacterized protein involved in exopolysaccharide biosynthesis
MRSTTTDREPMVQTKSEEISFIEIFTAVLRNWRTILLLPPLVALLAGTWAFFDKRNYVASASFMQQSADTRGVGGAAALAQQFGINLLADRPGHSPQFYEDLIESTAILRRAVESEYTIPSASGQAGTTNLIQYWDMHLESGPLPAWRRAVDRLRRAVSTGVVRETGVIQVSVSTTHPLLAEQITQRLLDLLNEYNLEMRQARARDEARFITGRLKDVQGELTQAERALQSFLSQNRSFSNAPHLAFEHDRLQRQVMMRQEVYTSLLRAQEQAQIDGLRDTPLLTVLDQPAGSAAPASRRLILRVLIGFMLGLFFAVAVAAIREIARRGRQSSDPRYREFEDLVSRVWTDVRHPSRWVRNGEKRIAAAKD